MNTTLFVEDSTYIQLKSKLREARNNSDLSATQKCLDELEVLKKREVDFNPLTNYYIAYVKFSQTYFLRDSSKVLELIDSAITTLSRDKKGSITFVESQILLSALYNNKMGIFKNDIEYVLDLKRERDKILQTVWKLNKKNPRYFLVKAEGVYYTPEEYGGGKIKAKPIFEKALKPFNTEDSIESIMPDWGYIDLLFWLGHISEEEKNYSQALQYYEALLRKEPNHKYVRDDLLPGLYKKLNSSR